MKSVYSEQGDSSNSQEFYTKEGIHLGTAHLDTKQMLWIIDVEVPNKRGNALTRKRFYRPTTDGLEIAISKYIKTL